MSCQCRFYSNFSRFLISDFPNQDHIRILSQGCTKGFGKVEILIGINLDLSDSGELIFHLVFYGQDVP